MLELRTECLELRKCFAQNLTLLRFPVHSLRMFENDREGKDRGKILFFNRIKMKERNLAFIDWQNLHLWTIAEDWIVDFKKFRKYLKDKFNVERAYFFMWFSAEVDSWLYTKIQKAWFILVFKWHPEFLKSEKKGNIDSDLVFEVMREIIEWKDFDKIVIVSWDWDYMKMIRYLIEKDLFKKILFPNKKYSSLYKWIKDKYWLNLSLKWVKKKIFYDKKRKSRS